MNTKIISTILSLALTLGLCQTAAPTEAATPQLSTKKLTIKVGKTATLKVKKTSKNTKKKAKWTVASGKKVIRLSEKKKASVKVKALKVGMAKISCKIGTKKLTCRVVVKGNTKPEKTTNPTVTPTNVPTNVPTLSPTQSPAVTASATPSAAVTVTPSSMPTSTPYDINAYELKTINTPGSVADYDCLKVEVGLHKSYLDKAHFVPGEPMLEEMQFFETGIWREEIEQITISNSKEVPKDVIGKYDLSEKQNGSVMAWYTDQDADGKYEMTIGQDGGVVANPNSSYLFCQINNREKKDEGGEAFLQGIENLDTSHVVDMTSMFEYSGDYKKQMNLGDKFDTSSVKDISYMFRYLGYFWLEELVLGDKFCVSNIETVKSAFDNTGDGDIFKCVVKDAETKAWFRDRAEEMHWHIGVLAGWQFDPQSTDNFIVSEK